MPPDLQMYCREQIFITGGRSTTGDRLPGITYVLKEFEKAMLLMADSAGGAEGFGRTATLEFAAAWFARRNQEELDRLAQEEAWRQYWGGKRGEVKALFDSFDLDGSGAIDYNEMKQVLSSMPSFFGFTENAGVNTDGMVSTTDANAQPPELRSLQSCIQSCTHTRFELAATCKPVRKAGRSNPCYGRPTGWPTRSRKIHSARRHSVNPEGFEYSQRPP